MRGRGFFSVSFCVLLICIVSGSTEGRSCKQVLSESAERPREQKDLTKSQINRVVSAVRSSFKDLREDTAVLPARWRRENAAGAVASVGFCFAATNAVFFMLGGKEAGLTPMVATYVDENGEKASHWWLRTSSGDYIDPTEDQYTAFGEEPPYELGRGCGFCKSNEAPTRAGAKVMALAKKRLKERGFQENGLPLEPTR